MMRRKGSRIGSWAATGAWVLLSLVLACDGPEGPIGPEGPEGPIATSGCAGCHDAGTSLAQKRQEYEASKHAWGGNHVRGTSASCAGCHSHEGFTARIAAGIQPNELTEGVPTPTPIGCRTCHQIHTGYTVDDWTLEVREPVTLMVSDETFGGGAGSLCAACHQPRSGPPEFGGGDVSVAARWDAHRTQAAALLGIGGYGPRQAEGPHVHYTATADSCVTCHMGPRRMHTKTAQVEACLQCHGSMAPDFDHHGVRTRVKALYSELEDLLLDRGILASPGGLARPGTYPEEVAGAFWNYKFVYYDRSYGVHNPRYIQALLEASIEALE